MSLPPEVKLQTILQKKEDIRKTADEISEITKKLGKGSFHKAARRMLKNIPNKETEDPYYRLGEQGSVVLRQKLHKMVSDISVIAGFCDKRTQNYIMQISKVAAEITAQSEITNLEGFILESFCTMVNSIIVDFNKTPFSLSAEFKVGFDKFMASVKTKYKKGKSGL